MNKRVISLDFFRLIMAITIVFSHLPWGEGSKLFKYIFFNTGLSVNYFFILSGFGLCIKELYLPIQKSRGGVVFAYEKMKKIYPVYFLTMLVCIPIYIKWHSGYLYLKFFLTSFFLQSFFPGTEFTHAYNGVGWFLSVLFFCYLVFPLFFATFQKYISTLFSAVLFIIFDSILVLFFPKILIDLDSFFSINYFCQYASPLKWLPQFVIGMHLGYLSYFVQKSFRSDVNKKKYVFIIYSIFEFISITLCLIYYIFLGYVIYKALPWSWFFYLVLVAPCLLVLVFSFEGGCVSKLLNKTVFQKMGNIAMYLYLIHYPLVQYLGIQKFTESTYINRIFSIALILFFSIVLSYGVLIIDSKLRKIFIKKDW